MNRLETGLKATLSDSIINIMGFDPKDSFVAKRIIETEDEFYASEEFSKVWEGFQGKDRAERVGREFEFIRGYVVEMNPETNYGRDFDLYKLYKTSEGLPVLKKQTIGASISSQPMREVFIFSNGFIKSERYFKKTKEARDFLAEHQIVVM